MPTFLTTRLVEFSDTDMAGIVHFANFFRFMESAEHAYLRGCGLSVVSQWQGQTITAQAIQADLFGNVIRARDGITVQAGVPSRHSHEHTKDTKRGKETACSSPRR